MPESGDILRVTKGNVINKGRCAQSHTSWLINKLFKAKSLKIWSHVRGCMVSTAVVFKSAFQ